MEYNFFGRLFKFFREIPLTLSPKEAWVFEKLQELTKASAYDIVMKAHKMYAIAHTGSSIDETFFAQTMLGVCKEPIRVSDPSALVELPPEAYNHTPLTIPLPRAFQKDALLQKYILLSNCADLPHYIGNALYFYYHVLSRYLNGQVIYFRTAKTADFKRVRVCQ